MTVLWNSRNNHKKRDPVYLTGLPAVQIWQHMMVVKLHFLRESLGIYF